MADTVRVSVRLPKATVAQVDKEAQANYLTRSDIIRRVLGLYTEGQQAQELRGGESIQDIDLSKIVIDGESRAVQVG